MDTVKKRFHGIYWRQFSINAALVLLTLVLLGASFFSLSYTYLYEEKRSELEDKARIIAIKAEELVREQMKREEELQRDPYSDAEDYRNAWNENLEGLIQMAQEISDIKFLIWIPSQGRFISTDDTMINGMQLTLPAEMGKKLVNGETYAGTSTLGFYEQARFVVAVPSRTTVDGMVLAGPVLAITEQNTMTEMWRAFLGIFMMTAVTVLLVAFMVTATTTMQQTKPINDIVSAARKFADGNFDARVYDSGRDDEIGELTEAFNAMADSLQRTEQQRREFIANVSHELKTPMTTIAGYADGILDGVISPEEERQYLTIISQESRRLSRLVRRMLDVSQLQSIDMIKEKRPFDLSESMRRVLISMEKKITDRGLDVDVEIPEDAVMVLGDNDLLTQVVYNLLENAVKFASAGSTLFLGLEKQRQKAIVTVRNHGATIDAEELPKLFERFHKSDLSRSVDKDGVGLGLYIVRTILDQHREKITATSQDGVTTFSFTVQLAEEIKGNKSV
ncbi:MAG: HAMP domain-containing protein [Oscillospiraceae bacterium]|nr:HAMP domain-containing protein [Oscillospiraceae bacterium]